MLVDFFFKLGEGIDGVGPKSLELLHSSLGRQYSQFGGKPKWTERMEIVATLMFGLIKNHPFYDANKRTAFLVSLLHLQKIGRTPKVPAECFEDFTVLIADNKLQDRRGTHIVDADECVVTIAEFLRQNTRDIDLKTKQITYRELEGVISQYGLDLRDPKGNRIDVVRVRESGSGDLLSSPQRIARIGFHGWTKEVSRTDIHNLRSTAKLDPKNGIDSQSFFAGVDGPLDMIRKYEEPLRRLAFR